MQYKDFIIDWDGEGSLRVTDDGFTVAVNPSSDLSPDFEAGIVLITGEEFFDREKVADVCGGRTCVIFPESMDRDSIPCEDVEAVSPGQKVDIFGIKIEGVETGDSTEIGYLFDMRGTSFYVAGRSELVDDLLQLENRVNLAFLPTGSELMDADEVVKAAVRIKPEYVAPYHYGDREEVNLKALEAELEDRNIGCEIIERNS